MTWFRFDRPFDFSPTARKGMVTVAYPVGVFNVTRECASKAEAAGAGKPAKASKAGKDDGEETGRR